ncbi:MAG TPA: MFS transporter [Vicinamibacteria bacterium]|nr:MFS transporter [Vicinamibacteria bacterium]
MSGNSAQTLGRAEATSGEARLVSALVSLLTLGLVDNQLIAPLLPEIASSFGTGEAAVGRTVSGYALAAALAALLIGPFSDVSGRKRFLVLAGVGFSLSSGLVAFADTFAVFTIARVLTGASAGVISALVVAGIADLVPYERRGRVMSWVAAAYFAAPILGVPLGSWAADRMGWRTNYAVFASAGVLCAWFIQAWFREEPVTGTPSAKRWPRYWAFLSARSTAAGALSAFFVTGGLAGFLLFLGAYLRERFSLSLTEVGLVFLLCGLASLAGAFLAGGISDRIGKLRVALTGSLVLGAAVVLVPYAAGFTLYALLSLVGLSAAARVAPLQSLVTELVSKEERGSYVAVRNTLSQCGMAVAAALGASLYESSGFTKVCWFTAGFSFLAFALLMLVDEPRRAEHLG